MEEEKDPRFRRLSTIGAAVNFAAVVLALAAIASYKWATLHVSSYVAGTGAIICTMCLAAAIPLSLLIVAMHRTQDPICLKFRHAVFARLIFMSAAAVSSLIACICFFLEAKIFTKMQSGDPANLGWSFYMEIGTFFVSVILGVSSSYEWRWSRKIGGDPTVYSRDPEGTKADTIINQNFREGPRNGTPSANSQKGGSASPHVRSQKGAMSRSGGVHRNANGVAMTKVSGLPYSITANGSSKWGTNGHVANGRPMTAFDPKRTPLRSSLRRPKANNGSVGEETTDSPTTGVIHNPTFANTSPTPKKKVRIHTQSTAV